MECILLTHQYKEVPHIKIKFTILILLFYWKNSLKIQQNKILKNLKAIFY